MEVLVGPTYNMDVSAPSPAAFVRDRTKEKVVVSASCLFMKDRDRKFVSGYGSDDSSDNLSSIGDPEDDSDEDEDKNDVVSSSKDRNFSLDSLEDSLPIKRGLSNHFSGKSKSFANLGDVSTVNDLVKTENPLNKRRRVLIATKLSRRSSFYSWQNPISMPLLTLHENDSDENKHHQPDNNNDDDGEQEEDKAPTRKLHGSRKLNISFKSKSCFALSDLHEEHDDQ